MPEKLTVRCILWNACSVWIGSEKNHVFISRALCTVGKLLLTQCTVSVTTGKCRLYKQKQMTMRHRVRVRVRVLLRPWSLQFSDPLENHKKCKLFIN